MNKKKGVTLIEIVISISILILVISIWTSLVVKTNRSFKIRQEEEEVNRVTYSIMQEVKYNHTMEAVVDILKDGYLGLKRDENLLSKLQSNSLFNLDKGNDIKIYMIGEENNSVRIKISVDRIEKSGCVEREFEKYRWMDDL